MYLVSFDVEVLTLISEVFGLSVQGTAPISVHGRSPCCQKTILENPIQICYWNNVLFFKKNIQSESIRELGSL